MKNLISIICLTVMFLLSFSVVSIAHSKVATPKCDSCEKIAKITQDLKKLDYAKKDDRFKGDDLVQKSVPEAVKLLKLEAKDPARIPLFKEILLLAREGGPYDGESQIMSLLAEPLEKQKDLKTAYDTFLKELPKKQKIDRCKNDRLTKGLDEAVCLVRADFTASDDPKKDDVIKKCIQPFDYAACIK